MGPFVAGAGDIKSAKPVLGEVAHLHGSVDEKSGLGEGLALSLVERKERIPGAPLDIQALKRTQRDRMLWLELENADVLGQRVLRWLDVCLAPCGNLQVQIADLVG